MYQLLDNADAWLSSPFPSTHYQSTSGHGDWATIPNPYRVDLIDFYRNIAESEIEGFGLTSPAYLRFTQPIDVESMPEPNSRATIANDSPVYLVNIDSSSPEYGARLPFRWSWNESETPFYPANTLALAPSWGRPLLQNTVYAWVIERSLRSKTGESISSSPWSDALLRGTLETACTNGNQIPNASAQQERANDLATWMRGSGRQPEAVAAFFTFKTQPLFSDLEEARTWLDTSDEAPSFATTFDTIDGALSKERTFQWNSQDTVSYRTVSTRIRVPNFQEGSVPYTENGNFFRSEQGALTPYRFENIRSFISFPDAPAPNEGWPVVLYIHGTGGSVSSGHATTAGRLAAQGFAMVSMELPLHGERAEGRNFDIGVSTFNFLNPDAGRTNFRQGAIDILSVLSALEQGFTIPADVAGTDVDIDLKPGPVHVFGHSQGGLSAAIAMPFQSSDRGWILSGTGGGLTITLLERKDPVDFGALIRFLLEFDENDTLDEFHPILALIQTAVDITDPIHFSRYAETLEQMPHILVTNGCWDKQTPFKTTDAMALALNIPLVEPVSRQDHPFSAPLGRTESEPAAEAARLSGYVEWCVNRDRDTHFVVFNRSEAIETTMYFLRGIEQENPMISKPDNSVLR